MGIDFRGIRMRLLARFELFRLRAQLAQFKLMQSIIIIISRQGTQGQQEQFSAEAQAHVQDMVAKERTMRRQVLFESVGEALSVWARMEDLLVAIASLLLRTFEAEKVGTILYSITNFYTWLSIISDLFSLDPLYSPIKPKWNKISERLRELNDIRVRLAHHAVSYGDTDKIIADGTSLVPGYFDIRPKSKKHRDAPLSYDQIISFIGSVHKVVDDLRALLESMTELLKK